MKHLARATVLYFALIFVFKLYGKYTNDYWANSYWFVSSNYLMLIFATIRKFTIDNLYKSIFTITAIYWAVMALLRLYLYVDIDSYEFLIKGGCKYTVGAIFIITCFLYLTCKIWYRK